jgi:hypothetical protein
MRRLAIKNSLKCMGTLQIFIDPHWYFIKVRSAESSFGQKVWSTFLIAQSDFVHFPMGHCCLLLNEIKVSLNTVMYYFSTKSLSKYLTAYDRSCDTVTFKIINNCRREIQLIELVI